MNLISRPYSLRFFALQLALLLSLLHMHSAYAYNEGGGSGATNTVKLDPFVVNLTSYERFLQTTITLQLSAPEVGEQIKVMMPKIRHVVILLLSSKDADTMKSSEGKKALIKELKVKINQAIDAKGHDGVSDIYLENFVIQ